MKKLLTLFAIFTILSMFVTVNAQTPGGVNVPQGGTGLVSIPQYGWLSGGGAGSPLRLISSTSPTVGWLTSTSTTISSIFPLANITKLSNLTSNGFVKTSGADGTLSVDTNSYLTGSGAGVTAVSVASSNGFAGSSSGGATPALTLSTTITGLLKGNGTAISAATNGTDYTLLTSTTCGAGAHISAVTAAGAVTCSSDSGGGGGGTGVGWLWNSINSLYQSTTTDDVLLGASATTSTAKLEVIAGGSKPAAYFNGKVGIGTTTPVSTLDVNGSFHVEEQNIATSTSMSVDFCSPNTSNFLRGGPGSSNITFTWTNYSACPGKRIFVEWFNPSSGLIGSTTFTAAKLHWNGYIDPGSNVNLGGIDTFVFTALNGSSTPYILGDTVSTLP